ncbi:MAG: right-handed parallel beta-helix repeat-containing protein [candidate division Zixibacteria bacterium]|nr:right-handed parallel beta-helix repeat-containing protein [candidate division Zixibacteria bacterium]
METLASSQYYSLISNDRVIKASATWHVSVSGSDVSGNGSVGNEFRTIQHAVDLAIDNDSILVAPGTYNEQVKCSTSLYLLGSGAENTIIDAGGVSKCIFIRNFARPTVGEIAGFTLMNSGTGSTDNTVNCGLFLLTAGNGNWIVRNNIIVDNPNIGFVTQDGGLFEKNVIYSNGVYGIFVTSDASTKLYNNTISGNGWGIFVHPQAINVDVQNNIIVNNNNGGLIVEIDSIFVDYNDVWGNGWNYGGVSPGTNDISADPLFVGGSPFDFHLLCNSPCIDAGNPTFPKDADSSVADIGAFPFDVTLSDADGDGVSDCNDVCEGFDDNIDSDSDGTPDGCDNCPSDSSKIESGVCGCGVSDTDSDGDGTPDCNDICPGFDDSIDSDSDGAPDGCDICPGFNDTLDSDGDGLPNGCDPCPFNPTSPCCCAISGDADDGGDVNVGDATFIVKYIFQSGGAPPCLDQADSNGSNSIDIGDATYIVKFVFQGGAAPICGTTGM